MPRIHTTHGPPRGSDRRQESARKTMGLPSWEDKMEAWYETGEPPEVYRGSQLVPVDGAALEALLRRYSTRRYRLRRRLHDTWLTLRHGSSYWGDW